MGDGDADDCHEVAKQNNPGLKPISANLFVAIVV
jgi:hypothetical protein